jgi:N-acetylglucosamine-6-phosphate deacetylase
LTPKGSALVISNATGRIEDILEAEHGVKISGGPSDDGAKLVDLHNAIVAPGFLELQTNGMRGFHFTHFEDPEQYRSKVNEVAKYLPSQGVTGFWATIPTVESTEFKKVGSRLSDRSLSSSQGYSRFFPVSVRETWTMELPF